jgi:hypothetical protein
LEAGGQKRVRGFIDSDEADRIWVKVLEMIDEQGELLMSAETTMAAAFVKAGYQYKSKEPPGSPRERLERLMALAIGGGGGRADPSIDNFIKKLLAENDAALIWAFFEDVRMPVVRRFFELILWRIKQENEELSDKKQASGGRGGQTTGETQRGAAAPPPRSSPTPPAARALKPKHRVPAVPAAPAAEALWPTLAVGEALARKSQIDNITFKGVPFGDLKLSDAAKVKTLRGREALYLTLLLSRLQAELEAGGQKRIRDFIDSDEADKIWVRVLEMMDEAA